MSVMLVNFIEKDSETVEERSRDALNIYEI